jgi:(2Fe-2S) ferredoxin
VIRLAHAYAIADASPALGVEHIDAALALWTFCARSMERIFGVPTGSLEPQVDPKRVGRLFEFVARQGDWVNREQITNLFHRNVTKTDLDAIIDSLLDDGLIERRVIQTSGRPRTEYHACGSDSDTFFVSSYPDQSRRSLQ